MFEFLQITYQSHSASFTSEYFPQRTPFWLFDCKWLSYGLGSSNTKFVSNFTMSLLWMIFGVIYQLNSLLKAQAFPLFCDFFICTTMTFQAILSGESGLHSVKRWFFCCSIFAAGLTRHTKSHFRTSFPVRCFFRGRNRTFRSVTY